MLHHKCLNHKRTCNPQHLKSSLFLDGNHGLLSSVLTMATRAMICGGTKFTVSSRKSIRRKIFDAIRSSLHGKAGSIAVRLGTEASITDILKKMDSVFGEVDTETDLLAALYSARQGPAESVSDWGCRLETLFDAAKRQATIPAILMKFFAASSGLACVKNSRMFLHITLTLSGLLMNCAQPFVELRSST